MAGPMFNNQDEIDAFDEMIGRYHNMWDNGVLTNEEVIVHLIAEGYSPIMAERVINMWMPIEKRPVVNIF